MAPTDQPAAYGLARPVGPQWQPCALMVEKCLKPDNAADLKISTKEISDEDGMLLDHMERPVLDLRSEEHTSELQSRPHLVCRLLLEKKTELRAARERAPIAILSDESLE